MGTNSRQNRDFKDIIVSEMPDSILETAIDWISRNMNPADVFSKSELSDWADDNGYVVEGKIDYEGWAADNDYIKNPEA